MIEGLTDDAVSPADRALVAQWLGREPRGLEAVQVRNARGDPSVVRVASLVDGKPFPTLFWLVDKQLNYQIDRLEAAGKIAELQQQIDASPALQAGMASDHLKYIGTRERYMSETIRKKLTEGNYYERLQQRGIGGIADFSRVRCLHTYYAAHLVQANLVGSLVDKLLEHSGHGATL